MRGISNYRADYEGGAIFPSLTYGDRFYCVLWIDTGGTLYEGPSPGRTAECLVPGTVWAGAYCQGVAWEHATRHRDRLVANGYVAPERPEIPFDRDVA